ncbi:hypothetical protein F5Y16DRAFT_164097 [Xylariaceae sp. FL0255]|nr:hypothetical protein F5Y16DRAFT_164097 [Xylariaceae sp. FL0255]
MPLSDIYKPLSRLRQPSNHQVDPMPEEGDYDPDMLSKEKGRQKEAVKRHLAAKIRNDWVFQWPPVSETKVEEYEPLEDPSPQTPPEDTELAPLANEDCDDDDDAASVYSIVSEDPDQFVERLEWTSEWSDDEGEDDPALPSAYRFESPDTIGSAIKASKLERSAKHRRAERAEMAWNSGLACFNARRDAWTGAKIARVRPKAPTNVSSPTKRLSFWRRSTSTTPSSPTESTNGATPLSPTATRTSGDTTAVASSDNDIKDIKQRDSSSQYPVQTLLPVTLPLIPPANVMRASITPNNYGAIYDKIVVNGLTPGCPINLGDVLRSCVVGWKRDGEWPPKGVEIAPVMAVKKKRKDSISELKSMVPRRLSFNFLGRRLSAGGEPNATPTAQQPLHEHDDANKGGMRKSLQRVLGLGPDKY